MNVVDCSNQVLLRYSHVQDIPWERLYLYVRPILAIFETITRKMDDGRDALTRYYYSALWRNSVNCRSFLPVYSSYPVAFPQTRNCNSFTYIVAIFIFVASFGNDLLGILKFPHSRADVNLLQETTI